MDDADADAFAQSLLGAGESLLWRQVAPATAQADMLLLALMASAVVGAVVWRGVVAWRENRDYWQTSLYAVVGAAAIGACLYCWGQTLGVGSTVYAVTDQRVIIASRDPWPQVRAYGPAAFERMHRSGDRIAFHWGAKRGPDGYRDHLFGLSDPAHVEHLIRAHLVQRTPAGAEDGCVIRVRTSPPAAREAELIVKHGAGDEIRTHDPNLGKVVLYP